MKIYWQNTDNQDLNGGGKYADFGVFQVSFARTFDNLEDPKDTSSSWESMVFHHKPNRRMRQFIAEKVYSARFANLSDAVRDAEENAEICAGEPEKFEKIK